MLIVGSLLTWVEVDATLLSSSVRGIDTVYGIVVLACGAAASAAGVLGWLGRDVAPIVLVVVGTLAVLAATIGVGTRATTGTEALAERTAAIEGISIKQARLVVEQSLRFGTVGFSGGAGVYLSVAGGLSVLASAWLEVVGRRLRRATSRGSTSRIVVDVPPSGSSHAELRPGSLDVGSDHTARGGEPGSERRGGASDLEGPGREREGRGG